MPVRTMPIGDGSSTHCKSDKDCPSSYCMRDPTKKAPYMCKDCGPNCCNSNADCPGSYCMEDSTKTAPYTCHGASKAQQAVVRLVAKMAGTGTGSSKQTAHVGLHASHASSIARNDEEKLARSSPSSHLKIHPAAGNISKIVNRVLEHGNLTETQNQKIEGHANKLRNAIRHMAEGASNAANNTNKGVHRLIDNNLNMYVKGPTGPKGANLHGDNGATYVNKDHAPIGSDKINAAKAEVQTHIQNAQAARKEAMETSVLARMALRDGDRKKATMLMARVKLRLAVAKAEATQALAI